MYFEQKKINYIVHLHIISPAVEVSEYVLCSESECSASDGGWQVQAFRDLPPQLFIYDLHQPPLLCHQLVQHVEVQHLFGHDGNPVHWGPCAKTNSCVERHSRTYDKLKKLFIWEHLGVFICAHAFAPSINMADKISPTSLNVFIRRVFNRCWGTFSTAVQRV